MRVAEACHAMQAQLASVSEFVDHIERNDSLGSRLDSECSLTMTSDTLGSVGIWSSLGMPGISEPLQPPEPLHPPPPSVSLMSMKESDAIIFGYVSKQSKWGPFPVWKKQWCKLVGSLLFYSNSEKMHQNKCVDVSQLQLKEYTSKKDSFSFYGENGKLVLRLAFDDAAAMHLWWQAITKVQFTAASDADDASLAPASQGENKHQQYKILAVIQRGLGAKVYRVNLPAPLPLLLLPLFYLCLSTRP